MIKVGFKRLRDDAILPVKAHPTDSGFDLFANDNVIIEPGETEIIKTGIAIHLPAGHDAQVRPRSGVTSKTKLRVQLGTIDQDYTGEIGIIVDNVNYNDDDMTEDYLLNIKDNVVNVWDYLDSFNDFVSGSYLIQKGDKLAQLVVQAIPAVESYELDKLPQTARGVNGFGSTGYEGQNNGY